MLGTHRRPRAGLLIILGMVIAACSSRDPQPPEPLDLSQPIAVDQAGQEVRFEFETSARNFMPYRIYALELELKRQGAYSPEDPDMDTLVLPFEVTFQQWNDGAWVDVPTEDSYVARNRNLGEPLPAWHTSSEWRYARFAMGSGGHYTLHVVTLPLKPNTRYRLQARSVQAMHQLRQYVAKMRVHAALQLSK